MPPKMNWTQIRKILIDQDRERLIETIKGLYTLSPQNKAFLHTQFSESHQDPAYLEACRKRIVKAIYPNVFVPGNPKFAQARKAVNDYKKDTNDLRGTIDLELTIVEQGTELSSDYGDFDMPFYERLETALFNAVKMIQSSPTRVQLYHHFQSRFEKLERQADQFGYGYGESIWEAVSLLKDIDSTFDPEI